MVNDFEMQELLKIQKKTLQAIVKLSATTNTDKHILLDAFLNNINTANGKVMHFILETLQAPKRINKEKTADRNTSVNG